MNPMGLLPRSVSESLLNELNVVRITKARATMIITTRETQTTTAIFELLLFAVFLFTVSLLLFILLVRRLS
jgi:hypothetical protein